MKKIVQLIPTVVLTLLLTGCFTNVVDLDEEGGGDGDNENNSGLVVDDRSQLNRQIFAESQVCEIKFTSQHGWDVDGMDERTRKWVTCSPARSADGGSFTLSVGVDENSTGSNRTAELQLFSGGGNETITISQSSQYKDGSQPQPYEKDAYTDIVEKITVQNYLDDEIEPLLREWRFITNSASGQVDGMECYLIAPYGKRMEEQVFIHDHRSMERITYGMLPGNRYDVVNRQYGELSVNGCNFIIYQRLEEFNYLNNNNQEPTLREITYLYSNYRRVSERSNYNTNEYRWIDGNMAGQADVNTTNQIKFAYGTQKNDRANIDLNTFLNGDMYAAMGLLGKRSKNLIASITGGKEGTYSFNYSFDTKGRVHTITRSHSLGGVTAPATTVFTISYVDGNDNAWGGGSK